jgi:hypothetical protein
MSEVHRGKNRHRQVPVESASEMLTVESVAKKKHDAIFQHFEIISGNRGVSFVVLVEHPANLD